MPTSFFNSLSICNHGFNQGSRITGKTYQKDNYWDLVVTMCNQSCPEHTPVLFDFENPIVFYGVVVLENRWFL